MMVTSRVDFDNAIHTLCIIEEKLGQVNTVLGVVYGEYLGSRDLQLPLRNLLQLVFDTTQELEELLKGINDEMIRL